MLNMVTLICGKEKLETDPAHAQRILHIQKEMGVKGWELPSDSPYEFKNNALITRPGKADCKGKPSTKGDTSGSKTPRKAPVSRGDEAKQD